MSNLQQSIAAVSGRFKSKSLSNQIPQWSILPQESSPLFIVLPTEIRLQIFCYSLTEDQVPYDRDGQRLYPFKEPNWNMRHLPDDTREPDLQLESAGLDEAYVPYSEYEIPGGDWLRPGTRGRKIQHTSILRTCRRVFVEARDMLMENATIRFFEGDYNTPPNCDHGRVMDMFTMPRYTANRLTSFHLFIPVHLLEHGYLFQRSLDMSPARDIRITIRLCDWWETDPSAPQLTPFGTGCVNRFEPMQMKEHMKLTEDPERSNTRVSIPPIPFSTGPRSPRGAWGAALSQFPRLQRFTMDFEYSEDGFDGLLELAEWAHRVWRFRLGGAMKGSYLSTAGIPIKKTTWRGLSTHWRATNWRHKAMHAQRLAAGEEEDNLAPCCARRRALEDKVIGPQMYTFTVTWTARKLEPEDGFDHSILGPEALSGQWNELPTDGVAEPLSLDDWYSGELPNYGLLHPNRTSDIDQPQY